eukprot:s604_g3.t1
MSHPMLEHLNPFPLSSFSYRRVHSGAQLERALEHLAPLPIQVCELTQDWRSFIDQSKGSLTIRVEVTQSGWQL